MPTSVITPSIPDSHQFISSSWYYNAWTELTKSHHSQQNLMLLILLGSSPCTSTDLTWDWWPCNVDNCLHKQFTSHNMIMLSSNAVICNQILIIYKTIYLAISHNKLVYLSVINKFSWHALKRKSKNCIAGHNSVI